MSPKVDSLNIRFSYRKSLPFFSPLQTHGSAFVAQLEQVFDVFGFVDKRLRAVDQINRFFQFVVGFYQWVNS